MPELFELAKENPTLRDGALSAALEEYVEAKSFGHYLATHRLLPLRDLPNVHKSEYIGGIIDLTGVDPLRLNRSKSHPWKQNTDRCHALSSRRADAICRGQGYCQRCRRG